jgi:hypothetical protein
MLENIVYLIARSFAIEQIWPLSKNKSKKMEKIKSERSSVVGIFENIFQKILEKSVLRIEAYLASNAMD